MLIVLNGLHRPRGADALQRRGTGALQRVATILNRATRLVSDAGTSFELEHPTVPMKAWVSKKNSDAI